MALIKSMFLLFSLVTGTWETKSPLTGHALEVRLEVLERARAGVAEALRGRSNAAVLTLAASGEEEGYVSSGWVKLKYMKL